MAPFDSTGVATLHPAQRLPLSCNGRTAFHKFFLATSINDATSQAFSSLIASYQYCAIKLAWNTVEIEAKLQKRLLKSGQILCTHDYLVKFEDLVVQFICDN